MGKVNIRKAAASRLGKGLIVVLAIGLSGCGQVDPNNGYTNASLYRTDVKTVCIEMFQSQSFRRRIEFDLTSAVSLQIEQRTPFKVVSDCGKADTVVYGNITAVAERVLSWQRELDRPVENEVVVLAEVTWKDLRNGELILDQQKVSVSGQYASLLAAGRESAYKQAANEMAVRIVEAMESPW